MTDIPAVEITDQTVTDTSAQAKTAEQVETTTAATDTHDLIIFGGAAVMLVVFGVMSLWIQALQPVVATNVATLIGAAAMYLKGK